MQTRFASAGRPAGLAWGLPLLAFCAVLPLVVGGVSCGHDYGFHLQSWMDAGQQIRQGDLLPRWAYSPAFNAGEPRFLFYPPLSWLLGSLLTLLLPAGAVVIVFTGLAMVLAAGGMYALARRYAGPPAALLASAVYLANPYLLFTAFERTAFAELLAAAWMPLLFRAALEPEPTVLGVAVPVALLWLTNAPAAVMGTYALLLLALLRVFFSRRESVSGAARGAELREVLLPVAGGLALGLSLAAFYLVPAALQRRYVQIAMAIIPNMRVEDNFLFGHTGYGPHDAVLHTASLVALAVIGLAALALALAFAADRHAKSSGRAEETAAETSRGSQGGPWALPSLAVLSAVIAVLLWHGTLPVWHVVPELAFLQFPWRLLSVLGCAFGLATAMALRGLRMPAGVAASVALVVVLAAPFAASRPFRQGCDAHDPLAARLALFDAHHGVAATDEYTPVTADNDQLRWDDPPFWLTNDLNAPGPGTVPNPASTIEDYDEPPPLSQTISGRAPMHLTLHVAQPKDLVLNLRDYPTWKVSVNGTEAPRLQRDDGLLTVPLTAGEDTVSVEWHALPDMWLGDAVSLCALAWAGWLGVSGRARSRRIER